MALPNNRPGGNIGPMLRLASLAAALLLLPLAKDAERPLDRVLLRAGREIQGHVVVEREGELVIRNGRKRQTFDLEDVSEVRSAWRAMGEFLDRESKARWEGAQAWVELAKWCDQVGLEREAKLASYHALLHDDDPGGVHERLGSKWRKEGWSLPWAGGWMALEEWRSRATTRWSEAPELDSSFFRVRSSSPTLQTLQLLAELGRGHRGWFRLAGDAIGQEHRIQLFEVALHGDEESFDRLLGNPAGYYLPAEDRIEFDGLRNPHPHLIHHEVAHQMLAEASRQHRSRRSSPAWIEEGLAEVLSRVLSGAHGFDGRRRWLMGSAHFGVLSDLQEAPLLDSLFELSSEEFHGAEDPRVPYALAYSLTVVCLGDAASDRRNRFFGFVEQLLHGKSDPEDLPQALGLSQEQLVQEWHQAMGLRGTDGR